MKMKPYLLFAVILIVNLAYADEDTSSPAVDSVDEVVRHDMEAILRNDEISQSMNAVVEKYGYAVVAAAEKYVNDKDAKVRLHAYRYIILATTYSTNLAERQEGVGKLLRGAYTDADTKFQSALRGWLLRYKSQDFSPAAVKLLDEKFAEDPNDDRTILLIGVAQDTPQLEKLAEIRDKVKEPLQPWVNDPPKGHKLAFAATMARARMGEKDDIKRCIELVDSHPDENFKMVSLLNKLSYVRQPEVVEYLKGYLLDNRYESGAGRNMTYGERAMLALEEMIEDFPSKDKSLKFDSVTKRTQYCYDWLNKQEKLNIIR